VIHLSIRVFYFGENKWTAERIQILFNTM
jgi:hypothetical protein